MRQRISQCQDVQDVQDTFLVWALDVERAVSLALQHAHQKDPLSHPRPALPRSARGRCTIRPRQWRRVPQAARCGLDGDYNPPEEAASVQARMVVRQVRRIQTYIRGRKYDGTPTMALARQLQSEWQAICRAKGFLPTFPRWLVRNVHFHTFWWENPPLEWVRDVFAWTKCSCDAMVRQAAKHRAQLAKFRAHWDAKHAGHKQAFASIKPPPHPPFAAVPVHEVRQARLSQVVNPTEAWYVVDMAAYIRHCAPCATSLGPIQACSSRDNEDGEAELLFRKVLQGDVIPWPPELQLEQQTVACSPHELEREFLEYWNTLWNRDRGQARHDAAGSCLNDPSAFAS